MTVIHRGDHILSLFCKGDDPHPSVSLAFCSRYKATSFQPVDGDANGAGREIDLRSDDVYRQRTFVEQGFHHPKISSANRGPLQIAIKLAGYRAERLPHDEPDVGGGCLALQTLLHVFCIHQNL